MFSFDIVETLGEPRIGRLKLGRSEIITPHCGIIHTEMDRLINGSNIIGQKNPKISLNEIVLDYNNQESINQLFQNNVLKNNLKEKIIKKSKKNVQNIFQLRANETISFSGQQLSELIEIQAESQKLSVITIPDPIVKDASISWKKSIGRALKKAEEVIETGFSYVVMPIISLNQPLKIIEKKIKWFIGQKVKSIGFRALGPFAPRLSKAVNLINIYENKPWIHLYDLNKKYLDVSQVHLVPLVGIDTVSVKKSYPRYYPIVKINSESVIRAGDFPTPEGIPIDADITKPIKIKTEKHPRDLFERIALGFLSEKERLKTFGEGISCNCPICQKYESFMDLMEFLMQKDRKSLIQVHETVSFENEMTLIQKAIHNNELEAYYESKTFIKEKKEKLSKKFPL